MREELPLAGRGSLRLLRIQLWPGQIALLTKTEGLQSKLVVNFGLNGNSLEWLQATATGHVSSWKIRGVLLWEDEAQRIGSHLGE